MLIVAPIGSLMALFFAAYLYFKIIREPRGNEKMIAIQNAISEGAHAYIRRQYMVVGMYFAVVFCVLQAMAFQGYLSRFVPFAFLTGGLFSALSGYIGLKTATQANSRTTQACTSSLNKGLKVAFASGSVMGLSVVGLGILDLSIWYNFLNWYYSNVQVIADSGIKIGEITGTMLTFGMGASSMALFARVGGGIFTKAADVGADLVGKVESNIPEDDPRNPAVIADNVGDNVGDVAGMGADLYESYVGSIVATMVLAVAGGFGLKGVTVPLAMATVGIISSILGTFLVKSGETVDQNELLKALRKGVIGSSILVAILAFFVVKHTLGMQYIGVYYCVLTGLIAGVLIGLSTEFYTSDKYKPTQEIAKSSQTGAATVIISGIATGFGSTAFPVIVVCVSIILSYFFASKGVDAGFQFNAGLYGISIAAVGMLSTLGITLATDAYGPVADNAGGIAEMSHQEPVVRQRTDALDSLGNTTAATGKGFAIGSAALTALALIAAFKDEVVRLGGTISLSLLDPTILVGLFIGAMLPFLFCAMTMSAVGRAAQGIVVEVRRQFKEIKGLMEGKAKADYARCVDICTKSAQKEMVLPAVLAILSPIIVGLLLNTSALIGLLAGSLASGFCLAVMMANSGGSWDNAKKFVEKGAYGGKNSPAHKACVTGDTVGDPFKDTSGPSLNILLKLMSMVSVVFASFIMKHALLR